jgi:hypothetical protein
MTGLQMAATRSRSEPEPIPVTGLTAIAVR